MKYTLEFTHTEVGALVDALNKGAARHESYAKFYPGRKVAEHWELAVVMRRLLERFKKVQA